MATKDKGFLDALKEVGQEKGIAPEVLFEAVEAFKKVFQHGGQKSEFYRDYAIALAYNDELDKAKEVLDHAEDYQIADDSLLYARGEIEKSSGNTDKAEEAFRDCRL